MKLWRLPCLLLMGTAAIDGLIRAEDSSLPGAGWPATRYEALWTKSPFAVATPDAAPESSAYSLWGIAQIDGVSYASLTDKQNNDHFVISSDKPFRGMTLVSVARGGDGAGTQAVIQKDGQSLTLKQEQAPLAQAIANVAPNLPPGVPPPNLQVGNPQANTGVIPNAPPTMPANFSRFPGMAPPPVMRRHAPISVPPIPQPQGNTFTNQSSK